MWQSTLLQKAAKSTCIVKNTYLLGKVMDAKKKNSMNLYFSKQWIYPFLACRCISRDKKSFIFSDKMLSIAFLMMKPAYSDLALMYLHFAFVMLQAIVPCLQQYVLCNKYQKHTMPMLAKPYILFILAHRSEDDVRKYTFSQTY